MDQDTEHLRLLSIFHYVMAGITAFFSCFGLFYVIFGLMMLFSPESFADPGHSQPPPPAAFGLMFALMGGFFVLGGWGFATAMFLAGRYLASRKHYLFCLIISGLLCMMMPFGTILGVFTIVVLLRPAVKQMFNGEMANQGPRIWEDALPHPSYTPWQTTQTDVREKAEAPRPPKADWR
jgi:hypothetical protein